jgi:hypothetical protein
MKPMGELDPVLRERLPQRGLRGNTGFSPRGEGFLAVLICGVMPTGTTDEVVCVQLLERNLVFPVRDSVHLSHRSPGRMR